MISSAPIRVLKLAILSIAIAAVQIKRKTRRDRMRAKLKVSYSATLHAQSPHTRASSYETTGRGFVKPWQGTIHEERSASSSPHQERSDDSNRAR
jgi:hypothetical protein